MSNNTLPREVWHWLHSLQLSQHIKSVRRDFSNGYLVAEIVARYYPDEVQRSSYLKGAAVEHRMSNWHRLEKHFARRGWKFPKEVVEGTMHATSGAAAVLICLLYSYLTHRSLPERFKTLNLSDADYQRTLPSYAQATAALAVKYNMRNSEISAQPDRNTVASKAEKIIATQQSVKKATLSAPGSMSQQAPVPSIPASRTQRAVRKTQISADDSVAAAAVSHSLSSTLRGPRESSAHVQPT